MEPSVLVLSGIALIFFKGLYGVVFWISDENKVVNTTMSDCCSVSSAYTKSRIFLLLMLPCQ